MHKSRREVLCNLAALGAFAALDTSAWSRETTPAIRINGTRLRQSLEALSVFGRPQGGTFADGVSRTAYSDADLQGRTFAMDVMRQAGLQPRIDTAGNIWGERAGSDASLRPILFGSHIDSVAGGGNFDGDLGSLGAIEIMRTLQEAKVATRHPLRMMIWQNEEGGLAGSSLAAGIEMDMAREFYGVPLESGIRRLGGDPARVAESRIASGSIHCYLELHIEQSGNLEKAAIPVGVVEGIVGIFHYDVEIRGFANHAGTTPMPERRNAMLAAAQMVEMVQRVITGEPGRQVGTVGHMEVFPNAPNVVPGLVKHTIDMRDLDFEKLERLARVVEAEAQKIAAATRTEIVMKRAGSEPPAIADPKVQTAIEHASAGLGLKTMRLPSGAGHDAQRIARLGPMGMIFVPSVGGISHSPKERTTWEDCTNGVNVLLAAILAMDAV